MIKKHGLYQQSRKLRRSPRASTVLVFQLMMGILFASFLCAAQAQNYGRRIIVPAHTDQRLDAAVDDLSEALGRITGHDFAVSDTWEDDGAAIVLTHAEHDAVPSDLGERLGAKDRETFLVYSDAPEHLWIVANHYKGLSHGIYYYLELLGCRWYYPNTNWEFFPELDDVTVEVDVLREPDFITRSFFGTGGFGPSNPVDPGLEMRDRWRDWQRRNRFGEQLITYGHVGHGFSRRYEEQLRTNPEFRPEIDGERVDYRTGVKFCVSNDQIMELFVEDRLRDMRRRVEADPESLSSYFVGVGPSDGGGFCECAECESIGEGTISDQVFYTANVVARAVAEEFPGRGVSTYRRLRTLRAVSAPMA